MSVKYSAGIAGVVGGVLWAVTPLRQPVFGAGRTADEGELFFRVYNAVLIAIAVLLTIALVRLRGPSPQRSTSFALGWWIILVGHTLLAAGSLPAVLFGDSAESIVTGGQDLGFLGAIIAALGALVLGVHGMRRRSLPRTAAALFAATLPLGLAGTLLLATAGAGEDYLGLPLTLLYGAAFVALGIGFLRGGRHGRGSTRPSRSADTPRGTGQP